MYSLRRRVLIVGAVISLAPPMLARAENPNGPALDVESALQLYQIGLDSVVSYDVRLSIVESMAIEELPPPAADKEARGAAAGPGSRKRLTYRVINPPRRVDTLESRQYLSNGRFRIDSLKGRGVDHREGELTTSWDGETQVRLNAPAKAAHLVGHAASKDLLGSPSMAYALLFRMALGDYGYADCVRQRPATIERRGAFFRVVAAPQPGKAVNGSAYGVEMDFDPEKAFMPARILWYITKRGRRVDLTLIENRLAEVQPGAWVPAASRVSFLVANQESPFFGRVHRYYDVTLNLDRSRFNVALDDSLFTLEIPMGYAVRDEVRQISYVSGAETHESSLDRLAAEGRLGIESLRQAEFGGRPLSSRMIQLLIFVNCALIASIAVGFVIRSRRRGRQ